METFYNQRQTVLMILLSMMDDIQRGRQSHDPNRRSPEIPETEVSDGHWNMAPSALRDDRYTRSTRKVWEALQRIREHAPKFHGPLASMFLRADLGHSDYERMRQAANHNASVAADWRRLQKALDLLTWTLKDEDLHARFPARRLRATTRRQQTMEENYQEIARVYHSWCADLSQRHDQFKRKALLNTAQQTGYAKSTVERAIKFHASSAMREAPKTPSEREHRTGCYPAHNQKQNASSHPSSSSAPNAEGNCTQSYSEPTSAGSSRTP